MIFDMRSTSALFQPSLGKSALRKSSTSLTPSLVPNIKLIRSPLTKALLGGVLG